MSAIRTETTSNRRHALALLGSAAATLGMPGTVLAQTYPQRPVRLVVGYSAGGGTDVVARQLAQRMSEALGQQVVVLNRPGATGAIAVEQVVHAEPDGYTLLLVSVADTVVPALRARMPYDLGRDLIGVAPVVGGPLALVVNPAVPAKTVRELIALARAQPGKLNYGSPGVGNSLHLAAEQFNLMAKTQIVHVPFKGAAEVVTATVSGEVDLCFPVLSTALPLVEAGKLRLLAVTGARRAAALPAVPTLSEAGVDGYDRTTWFGVAAPKDVPREIVQRLNAVITQITATAEMRQTYARQNFEAISDTAEAFTAFMRNEIAQNAQLIRTLGIKPE